jgi:D-ribose pyranose/furanose isomerase RbsD
MAFTLTIETMESGYSMTTTQTVKVLDFETKKEAQKEIRKMIKEGGYKKYAGHIFNSNLNTEILTNF